MKLRNKLLLSALIGFCAMLLSTTPMWWGVLFSPISQQLTSAPVTEDTSGGVCWEEDGTVLRFKSLDLLFSFLHQSSRKTAHSEKIRMGRFRIFPWGGSWGRSRSSRP